MEIRKAGDTDFYTTEDGRVFEERKQYHCRYKMVGRRSKRYPVHRLVAIAWCPGYAPDLQVDHVNEDRYDNRASNLEWVTGDENNRRWLENHPPIREKKRYDLTDKQKETYMLAEAGNSFRKIDKILGKPEQTTSKIVADINRRIKRYSLPYALLKSPYVPEPTPELCDLPEEIKQRLPLSLKEYCAESLRGKSHAEAAKALNCHLCTVKTNRRKAWKEADRIYTALNNQ